MSQNDTPSAAPDADPVATPEAAAAPAKRRTRKAPAVDAPAAEVGEAAQVAEVPVAPKPRRRKAAASADAAVEGAADAAADAARAPEPVSAAASAEERVDIPAAPADAAADAPDADAGESGESSGRRGRNRRRGRGKDRVERDGEPGAAPAAPAAPIDPADLAARFEEVLSGAYDAEPPEPDDEAAIEQQTKRVLRPDPEAPKLHKVLAQSGIGSRRDMEQLIADGAVTVNDQVAHVGMRIGHGDRVAVNGKPVRLRIQGAPVRLLAYHKPAGEVVTFNDPEGRPTVFRRLPRLQNGKWQSVGRLDINTEGLLLFTTSGELANQLMHPRFGVEREYAVRVLGSLSDEQRARLLEGVEIDGQSAAFKSIEDGGGDGANRWYRVVITEGRNREVRKLFDKVGLAVSRLIRIRYGTVVLPRGLRRGVWVELGDQDLRTIRQLAAGGRPPRSDAPAGEPREQRGGQRGPQQQRGPKGPRPPQQANERPPRREREPRPNVDGPDSDDPHADEFARIPNPLEQTFDRRFAKSPRRAGQGFGHGGSKPADEFQPGGTIPNPLEQTFDKRFVKGSQRINAGFGRPDGDPHGGPAGGGKKGGPKQPDPMQTSVGYIGADAYFNRPGGKRSGGGRGGSGGGGGGGGRRGR